MTTSFDDVLWQVFKQNDSIWASFYLLSWVEATPASVAPSSVRRELALGRCDSWWRPRKKVTYLAADLWWDVHDASRNFPT